MERWRTAKSNIYLTLRRPRSGRVEGWQHGGPLEEPGAHVYMLRCADGSYYVGSARLGLERRVSEHNSW